MTVKADSPAATARTPDKGAIRKIRAALPSGAWINATDDAWSDRIRCDHPGGEPGGEGVDGTALAETLLDLAADSDRGRVVLLAPPQTAAAALDVPGFVLEATMPGYYRGEEDCLVVGAFPDEARATEVPDTPAPVEPRPVQAAPSEPATPADAEAIAALLGATFEHYPTRSDDPAYVRKQLERGTPFRVVRRAGEVVACASADLVHGAKTAELTDVATAPSARGEGLAKACLAGLLDDLQALGFPTAYTLSRVAEPGINRAFARLGFVWRGSMRSSCRIGDGLEDMHVWSRAV